tara:strand:+ start:195 stop:590 length:396 start_codon:yes stop_codon:yes gene_type:complete
MRKINFPGFEKEHPHHRDEIAPRFIEDMCKPLFEIIRGLHLDQKQEVLGNYWNCALDCKSDEPEEYEDITTTDLALESFVWNIQINQPREGASADNALRLFMEVAHAVWRIAPLSMPNTLHRNDTDKGMSA